VAARRGSLHRRKRGPTRRHASSRTSAVERTVGGMSEHTYFFDFIDTPPSARAKIWTSAARTSGSRSIRCSDWNIVGSMSIVAGAPASASSLAEKRMRHRCAKDSVPLLTQDGTEEGACLLDLAAECGFGTPAGCPASSLRLPLQLKQSLEADLTYTEVWISRMDCGHRVGHYSRCHASRSSGPPGSRHDRALTAANQCVLGCCPERGKVCAVAYPGEALVSAPCAVTA
jgi:hypothetical protein